MLEFCETVSPTLQDYEVDGVSAAFPSTFPPFINVFRTWQAWPTLLDDFVVWKKSHATNGTPSDMETNH